MPATVTATFKTTGAAVLQGNSYVRFKLRNFAGFVPRVQSTGVVVEPVIDVFPDSSGDISQSVYMNSEIVPDTTFYTIEFWDQGRITSSGNYLINGATDLDSASQLNSPPVPPGFNLVLQHNGEDNSSQNILNLTSEDSSVTISDLGSGQIDLSASGGGFSGINKQTATSYTLQASDKHKLVVMATELSTVTIDSAFTTNFVVTISNPTNSTLIIDSSVDIDGLSGGTFLNPFTGMTLVSDGTALWSEGEPDFGDVIVPRTEIVTNTFNIASQNPFSWPITHITVSDDVATITVDTADVNTSAPSSALLPGDPLVLSNLTGGLSGLNGTVISVSAVGSTQIVGPLTTSDVDEALNAGNISGRPFVAASYAGTPTGDSFPSTAPTTPGFLWLEVSSDLTQITYKSTASTSGSINVWLGLSYA